jgi:hypothetical protein
MYVLNIVFLRGRNEIWEGSGGWQDFWFFILPLFLLEICHFPPQNNQKQRNDIINGEGKK